MALIKLGGVVTQISGKIGGQTFGTSASGAYMKNSGTPRKSITLSQRSKMSLMATTSQAWRSLLQSQRDVFNAASPDYPYLNRVGETKFYSGFAIFCKQLNNLILEPSGAIPVPVPLPRISFTPVTGASFGSTPPSTTFQANAGQSGYVYRLFMSRFSSVGISNPYKNQFFINSSEAAGSGLISIIWYTNYTAIFGTPVAGTKSFWRLDVVDPDTGQDLKSLASGVVNFG